MTKGLRRLFLALCIGAPIFWLATSEPARAQLGEDTLLVCADGDGLLRVPTSTACPPGQRPLILALAEGSTGEEPGDEERADGNGCDARRLAELERRLRGLEGSPESRNIGSRAEAPFEVVDRQGQRVFRVEEGYVLVFHPGDKKPVAVIRASENGGYFTGFSADRRLSAIVGASGDRANVFVEENGVKRVQLGLSENKNWSARFYGPKGAAVAGIGTDEDEGGLALVADVSGNPKAWIGVYSGKGLLNVGQQGKVFAQIGEGLTGGGVLRLFDHEGTPMVSAGVDAGGFGLVKTGPASFMTGAGLGLPGSYLMGKP